MSVEHGSHASNRSAATARGVLSFYDDLRAPPTELRVCGGTSCVLARAGQPARCESARTVYCLGYCDRSPARLRGAKEILLGAGEHPGATETPPAGSDVRCTAPQPIVTRRIGRGDFASFAAARADGAYSALGNALRGKPRDVLDCIVESRERGRGGAAYSTGAKWRACASSANPRRFVIANGDEGDPGSFIDRELLERDPHGVLEGLALCAYAVGASRAFVFVRSEYPWALERMERAVADARAAGWIGRSIGGSAFDLDVEIVRGLGSYVCGEETALIHAIEGRRGEVGIRPPYPTESGLFGCPTVVNNVETLVNVPWIVEHGAAAFAHFGTAESAGTKAICLNHGFARPGIVEVEFGMPLERVIEHAGGGARGSELEALAIGGPMGSIVTRERWNVPVCYRAMRDGGIELGHGGIVALPKGTDYGALALHWLEFMAHESCGRCAPCALGSKSALARARNGQRGELEPLLDAIAQTSLCAFGQLLPQPVRDLFELERQRSRA